jgi:carbonic anhydrase
LSQLKQKTRATEAKLAYKFNKTLFDTHAPKATITPTLPPDPNMWAPQKDWNYDEALDSKGPFWWWRHYSFGKGGQSQPITSQSSQSKKGKGETLPPSMGMCNGDEQSPIDIRERFAKKGVKVDVEFNWPNTTGWFFNHTKNFFLLDGTTIKNGEAITQFEGVQYVMDRIFFHKPAEHSMNTQLYPMEVQFSHKPRFHKDGTFGPLFVAVLYQLSDEGRIHGDWFDLQDKAEFKQESVGNPVLEKDLNWMNLPKEGQTAEVPGRCCQKCPQQKKKPKPEVVGCKFFDPKGLLPTDGYDYYQYKGSLTYPPCTQNVQWLVLKNHPVFTYEQLEALPIDRNYRPVALNKNSHGVRLNSGHPPKKAAPPTNDHAHVSDCGPWGHNCAGGEYFE